MIGNPHVGGDQQFSKLPAEPEPGKTMKLYVVPYGLRHGYRFTLTLEWVEGAKRTSKVIDNHGQDFLIMPSVPDQNYYTYGNPGERLKKAGDSRPWFLNSLPQPSRQESMRVERSRTWPEKPVWGPGITADTRGRG